jgi:hypothetical protein
VLQLRQEARQRGVPHREPQEDCHHVHLQVTSKLQNMLKIAIRWSFLRRMAEALRARRRRVRPLRGAQERRVKQELSKLLTLLLPRKLQIQRDLATTLPDHSTLAWGLRHDRG